MRWKSTSLQTLSGKIDVRNISKYITERGLHQNLKELYEQYPVPDNKTNPLVEAFMEGFTAGLNIGVWYAATTPAVKGTVKSTTINPNEIRYSQSSVNGAKEIIDSMKAKGWAGDPIDVVKMPDGKFTTVDNTRVLAAKNAGIDVQATVHVNVKQFFLG